MYLLSSRADHVDPMTWPVPAFEVRCQFCDGKQLGPVWDIHECGWFPRCVHCRNTL
jgi:hypothetical protein